MLDTESGASAPINIKTMSLPDMGLARQAGISFDPEAEFTPEQWQRKMADFQNLTDNLDSKGLVSNAPSLIITALSELKLAAPSYYKPLNIPDRLFDEGVVLIKEKLDEQSITRACSLLIDLAILAPDRASSFFEEHTMLEKIKQSLQSSDASHPADASNCIICLRLFAPAEFSQLDLTKQRAAIVGDLHTYVSKLQPSAPQGIVNASLRRITKYRMAFPDEKVEVSQAFLKDQKHYLAEKNSADVETSFFLFMLTANGLQVNEQGISLKNKQPERDKPIPMPVIKAA